MKKFKSLNCIKSISLLEEYFGFKNIKNCPFCNSYNIGLYTCGIPHMTCRNCNADGPSSEEPSLSLNEKQYEAIRLWNIRTI